jgi:N-acyl-D-aspartate/D-glutamate deacylase
MASMSDRPSLVIRNGTIADGTGAALREADIAIRDGRIVEVGRVAAKGAEEIDAKGKLVAPGFVDVHTHYDGQVTWSQDITPSSQHGVTTAVMGNCGVGFAPCKPADRDRLVRLMEGVEDIPEPVLTAGLPWTWESFPDYMDWLSKRHFDMDIGAQLPHAALRVYVMGERGARRDPATPEDNKAMARLAGEAMAAGALGFSTSRTLAHRTSDGDFTPTLKAGEDEITAVATAMAEYGKMSGVGGRAGVLQFVLDLATIEEDLPMMLRVGERTRCPVSFSVTQNDKAPDRWRQTMAQIGEAQARGLDVRSQIATRAIGLMLGLELSMNPFLGHPSYHAIAHLPLAERVRRMHDPVLKARILAEEIDNSISLMARKPNYDKVYLLGDPPDYEQDPSRALGPTARRQGRAPAEMAYEAMLENGGKGMLYVAFINYAEGNLDSVREMLKHPSAMPGLSDGGAHCGIICDASFPTHLLTHWTRDRTRGEKLSIPEVIELQCRKTARSVGLLDRGVIAPGYRADINVIDYERLTLGPPEVAYDLPKGGRRLMQKVSGYETTVVAGTVTRRGSQVTGARPGRLLRGAQAAPV